MDLKKHLISLSELNGPSGHEDDVRTYLVDVWSKFVDDFDIDRLGSLIAIKHGSGKAPRRKIMLAAHMDEIGLMVAEIREGYLRLENIQGIDSRTLQGKSVIVHGKRQLVGTVAAVPPHIASYTGDGRTKYLPLSDQWVDLGLPAHDVTDLVSIGDLVTMDAPVTTLKGGVLVGKAMDNRASIAAVTHCLELLQTRSHGWDVYAVGSVQEEVGHHGAIASANRIKPDVAIAFDVTAAIQPGVSDDGLVAVGKGPTLGLGPNFHPGLREALSETARIEEISLPIEPFPGRSGTDAWDIQVAQTGIPTALLNIPLRNMHTTAETVSLQDIKRTGRLLAEFIMTLDDDFLEKIAWKRPIKDSNR